MELIQHKKRETIMYISWSRVNENGVYGFGTLFSTTDANRGEFTAYKF